jgi:toxin ParE1/3/4
MSRDVRLRPAARDDLRAVLDPYRADSGPGIALAFADRVQRTLVSIAAGAETGTARLAVALDLPGLRLWGLSRFPHVLVGFERPDHVDVIRILHDKRDLPAAFRGA